LLVFFIRFLHFYIFSVLCFLLSFAIDAVFLGFFFHCFLLLSFVTILLIFLLFVYTLFMCLAFIYFVHFLFTHSLQELNHSSSIVLVLYFLFFFNFVDTKDIINISYDPLSSLTNVMFIDTRIH